MKITKLWIVKDPSPDSEMVDILFEADMPKLASYLLGSPHNAWKGENHTAYTEESEAKKDAEARMKKRPKEAALATRVAKRFAKEV